MRKLRLIEVVKTTYPQLTSNYFTMIKEYYLHMHCMKMTAIGPLTLFDHHLCPHKTFS